jgi:hypothetical protein
MAIKWLLMLVLLVLPIAGLVVWVWPGLEDRTKMLGILALAPLAVVAALWNFRIQVRRRRRTVWDAYAERVLARDDRHQSPKVSSASGTRRGLATPARQ